MTAYEIQPRYVIQDKIQSETKFSPTKSLRKIFFCWKKIKLSEIVRRLRFPVHKMSCLEKIDANHHYGRSNQCTKYYLLVLQLIHFCAKLNGNKFKEIRLLLVIILELENCKST